MTSLKTLKDRAEGARQNFEQARGSLYRGDGEPIYAEAEMTERIRTLRSERNRQLDVIETALEKKRQEASEDLQALEDGDPTAWLSREVLAHGASRLAFIQADVASLDDEDLRQRLVAVTHSGEPTSKLGYYLAARGRRKSEDLDAHKALEDLREAAIPETHRQKVQDARDRVAQAGEIKDMVYLARREQTFAYNPNYAVPGR